MDSSNDANPLRAVGIDWATEPKNRALAEIEWSGRELVLTDLISPLADHVVAEECKREDVSVIAVDIPFGWPRKFREWVARYTPISQDRGTPSSLDFRYRLTDQVVQAETGKSPLSVSSNLIAVGARAWAEAVDKHEIQEHIDVIGEGDSAVLPRVIEVYPAATLASFNKSGYGLLIDGYKNDEQVRRQLFQSLQAHFGLCLSNGLSLERIIGIGKHSDQVDAVIAAITSVIFAVNSPSVEFTHDAAPGLSEWQVRCPNGDEQGQAKEEGWIFFPIVKSAPTI
jgi:predicted nuclease with RNAse H fold